MHAYILFIEHRIFMEVAFAYQDKFKFAVCTNKQAVQDLKYVYRLWKKAYQI